MEISGPYKLAIGVRDWYFTLWAEYSIGWCDKSKKIMLFWWTQ